MKMAEKAVLVDTSKCIACKGCQIACKQWNELAAGESEFFASTDGYENPSDLSSNTYTLIKFHLDKKGNGDPDWLFRKKQCMHCTTAACLNNCPVSTIKRTDEGFVWVDRTGCIGCGTCVSACPFSIPRLSDGTGPDDNGSPKSYKCWGCKDRVGGEINSTVVKADPIPACVKSCPPGALTFGNRSTKVQDANDRKSELEAEGKTVYLYGVDELGGLHYIYILLRAPSFYGLPSLSELESPARRAYLKYLREVGKLYLKKVSSF
jgi:formate dehydrogenase iron-sulfur subunit